MKKILPNNIFIIWLVTNFIYYSHNAIAQSYQPTHHYTTQTGLPSNLIYELQQDTTGNLWICTNSGISQFDGKYFRNYTFRDGLPSDDVVACRVDTFGRLWLNCFGHKPTYYQNDAFYTIPTDLRRGVENKNYILVSSSDNEAEYNFGNPFIQLLFAKDKNYSSRVIHRTYKNDTTYINKHIFTITNRNRDSIIFYSTYNKQIIDSVFVYNGYGFKDRNGIFSTEKRILKEIFINAQCKFEKAEYACSNTIIKPCFSAKYIILVDKAGMVFIYNRATKKLIVKLQAPQGANCAMVDQYNQLWVGTKNDGLYCYAKSEISTYLSDIKNNQLISIYANNAGAIFAGNAFAQVHEIYKGKHKQTNFSFTSRGGNIKCILPQANEVYIVEDNTIIVNSTKENIIIKNNNLINQLKSGVTVNDSILFIGSVPGAYFLNTRTKKAIEINAKNVVRIYACAINKQGWVYFRYNDKIHKVHYPEINEQVLPIHFGENEVPTSLTCTDDGLLWIATNESKIYIVQNEKIIDTINTEISLMQNITHITSAEKKVVVSSKSGIAIIDYTVAKNIKYSIQFVSQQDGLPSAVVNQTCIANDSIYCATENGIAVLHKNFATKKFSIEPIIQSVKIDNILWKIQNKYALPAGVHSIKMQIGGVDISGHLYAMQYALNDTLHWNTLESNELSLLLQGNETKLYIRSKDIQNNYGPAILACIFDVAIPFYKTLWFSVLCTLLLATSIFYYFYRKKLTQQKIEADKQKALENQQQKITADLHDDIGATLSSLQLNSEIASMYLQKDKAKTAQVINTIEAQAKELSEKVGDIIWSMKVNEAFGNFSDRIKNYINQTLDHSEMNYKLNINAEIDDYIIDPIRKKNLLFIAKEAINNAVKFSKATIINVECTIKDGNIYCMIKDDGIGFDKEKNRGSGLNNMQNRAHELNGEIRINTDLNIGTCIEIIVPITNKNK
jgi:signal transduction histidine kinase/ligand-binding sensor domain-containing protein